MHIKVGVFLVDVDVVVVVVFVVVVKIDVTNKIQTSASAIY